MRQSRNNLFWLLVLVMMFCVLSSVGCGGGGVGAVKR